MTNSARPPAPPPHFRPCWGWHRRRPRAARRTGRATGPSRTGRPAPATRGGGRRPAAGAAGGRGARGRTPPPPRGVLSFGSVGGQGCGRERRSGSDDRGLADPASRRMGPLGHAHSVRRSRPPGRGPGRREGQGRAKHGGRQEREQERGAAGGGGPCPSGQLWSGDARGAHLLRSEGMVSGDAGGDRRVR